MAARTSPSWIAQWFSVGDGRRSAAMLFWVAALGLLYGSVVAWATLRPVPWATDGAEQPFGILSPGAWLDPASWTEGRPLEIVLNVAMFLPIGVVASLLFRGSVGLAISLALTLGIELAQIPLDRISHPRDLLANGLGALAGVALVALVRRRVHRPPTDLS